jgi:uncharacterized protein
MVKQTTAAELRRNLFSALDDVENGHTLIVSRHGKAVARLVGLRDAEGRPEPDQTALRRFCEKHGIRELSLFGSVLRDDFGPKSDVDVLFEPERGRTFSHLEYLDMETELCTLFGRRVDIVNRQVLLRHDNDLRRNEILSTARPIVSRKAK